MQSGRRGSPMSPGESAVRSGRAARHPCVRVNANAQTGAALPTLAGRGTNGGCRRSLQRQRAASVPSARASSTTGAADTATSRSPSRGSLSATSGPGPTSRLGPVRPDGSDPGSLDSASMSVRRQRPRPTRSGVAPVVPDRLSHPWRTVQASLWGKETSGKCWA